MKYIWSFFIRILLCLVPFEVFTFILMWPTLYLSSFLLYFYRPWVVGTGIIIGNNSFNLIEACIASGAFYLVWLLTLLIKDISFWKRVKMILFSFVLMLSMNVLRIALLCAVSVSLGPSAFEMIHMFFWKFVSGVYVASVWIATVSYFDVKGIPIVDDLKYLYRIARGRVKG